jgi:hypothetical protein
VISPLIQRVMGGVRADASGARAVPKPFRVSSWRTTQPVCLGHHARHQGFEPRTCRVETGCSFR